MGYRYTKYMRMGANQLHNELEARNLPPDAVKEIKRIVTEQKTHKRSQGAHNKQMGLQWGEFTAPLMHERKTVKSIMRYKGSPERAEALEAYYAVLDKLHDKLYLMRREKDKTPAQLHPDRTHWSDYVPQRIKDEVCDMFNAIPYKAKAKVKTPFARTVPVILHNKQRARLERRTIKELGVAETDYLLDPSDKNAQVVAKIKEALKIIRAMQPHEPVPATWHGFFE